MKYAFLALPILLALSASAFAQETGAYTNALVYVRPAPAGEAPVTPPGHGVTLRESGSVSRAEDGMGIGSPGYNPGHSEGSEGFVAHTPPAPEPACGYQHFVGKRLGEVDLTGIRQRVRVLRPGMSVTMDYSADRINLVLDKRGVIIAVRCG